LKVAATVDLSWAAPTACFPPSKSEKQFPISLPL